MKKRILTSLTLILTVLFSFGLQAAEGTAAPAKPKGKKAAMLAKLLPPELARSRNLVPEDAVAVGFINTEAITKGKLFQDILKAAGMDWDALLAAAGGKKEDAESCALFYIRLLNMNADAGQMPALEVGGAVVCKRADTVREQFEKSVEDIRKGLAGADPKAAGDVKVEKLKVGDKNAIRISMPSHNLTVLSIAAGRNVIQFRCFFNAEPVSELIPARGEFTKLAGSLNLNSAFSLAVDGARIRALAGEAFDSPELKAVHRASVSFTEKEKGLSIVARIASDLDGVQLLQPKIKAALEGAREDPMMGPVAAKTKVTVEKSTNVVVRSFIPSEMILQYVQLAQQMKDASEAPATQQPAAAPAAPASAK